MNKDKYRDTLQEGYILHWYEIKSVLGRGTFGVTYLAQDKNLNQLVAIKEYFPLEFSSRDTGFTVHPSTGESYELYAWGLDRFIREAQTLAKFKHNNIVRVMSVFEFNNTAYMIMEYEEGEDLSRQNKDKKNFSEKELLDIFIPILNGLKLVHDEGFIHRDIKPSNIYIRNDGSPVLIDFGAARKTTQFATRAVTSLLTHGYAPFEQYNESNDKQGAWTDIYALGACFYCAINGSLPLDALTRCANLYSSGEDAYEPISISKKGEYSNAFLLAIDNALIFDAPQRPQNVLVWADMLLGKVTSPALPKSMKRDNVEKDETVVYVKPSNIISSQTVISKKNRIMKADVTQFFMKKYTWLTTAFNIKELIFNNLKEAILLFLALIIVSGVFLSFYGVEEKEPQNIVLTEDAKEKITVLLKHANTARRAENLIETSDSALSLYQSVLNLDVNNAEAARQIKDIVKLYTGRINNDVNAEYYEKAQTNIKLLLAVLTNNNELNALAKKIKLINGGSQKINDFLKRAEVELNAGNMIHPKERNAVLFYRKVLNIDSDNPLAKTKLSNILNQLIVQITNDLEAGELASAENNILDVMYVDPDSSEGERLQTSLALKKKNISIRIFQAQTAFKQGNIATPPNNNALIFYRQVLKNDVNNIEATVGISEIKQHFMMGFDKNIKAKNFKLAESFLVKVEQEFSNMSSAKSMRRTLVALKNKDLSKKLIQARVAFKKGHITVPRDKNALSLYRQVLKSNENNAVAIKGIKDIEQYFKAIFDKKIKSKNFDSAESFLVKMEDKFSGSLFTQNMRKEFVLIKKKNRSVSEIISDLIDDYKKIFELRDMIALQKISNFKVGRKIFLEKFFRNYKSFKLKISAIKYVGSENKGTAVITLSNLINFTGSEVKNHFWSEFIIDVHKSKSGDWKVYW